jgi:hypothetical protein
MKEAKTTSILFRVSAREHEEFRRVAAARGTTMSKVLSEAMSRFCSESGKSPAVDELKSQGLPNSVQLGRLGKEFEEAAQTATPFAREALAAAVRAQLAFGEEDLALRVVEHLQETTPEDKLSEVDPVCSVLLKESA